MHKKRMTILALGSLLALSQPLLAEEATGGGDEGAQAPAFAAAEADAPAAEAAAPGASDAAVSAMHDRWREREARYEELKERAREVGVMLPDDPPWKRAGMGMMPNDMAERMQRHQAMMAMTPEELMATREAHYKEMQARAKERGIDLPDTPPWEARQSAGDDDWAKTQAVIDGMTDEERAACHAMHARQMGMPREMPERPMMRGPGMGPGMMGSDYYGPGSMGPGYGYGPSPYGQQNFWDPNR